MEYTLEQTLAASPAQVWRALTEAEEVNRYHLAPLLELDFRPGGRIRYGTPETEMIVGEVVEIEPERCFSHTFRFAQEQMGTGDDPETVVTYRLEPVEGGTRLTLIHSGFPTTNQTYVHISGGWPAIFEALRATLETR